MKRFRFGFSGVGFVVLCGFALLFTVPQAAVEGSPETARNQQEYLSRVADGDTFNYILISRKGKTIVAKDADSGKRLRKSMDPRDVIEWALTMADVTVLQEGRYALPGTLEVPRSGVSLVIRKGAELTRTDGASLTVLSEGHGNFPSLIRVKNRDHVRIVNLGTIDAGDDLGVTYDGRNGGTNGIEGGLLFSTGTLKCRAGFWVVDGTDVRVPLLWGGPELVNVPLVLEGCEEGKLGFIAGLMGRESAENETLDFNSYNRRVRVGTVLGWVPGGTNDEILDVNSSPNCTIERVVGYGPGQGTKLVSKNAYPPKGRRLTQKRHIDHSDGTVVKKTELVEKTVSEWKTSVGTPGFPEDLPVLKIDAGLTAVFEDGFERQVLDRTYEFDLERSRNESVPF